MTAIQARERQRDEFLAALHDKELTVETEPARKGRGPVGSLRAWHERKMRKLGLR
jgi:hypothetical protein